MLTGNPVLLEGHKDKLHPIPLRLGSLALPAANPNGKVDAIRRLPAQKNERMIQESRAEKYQKNEKY
jgi:hypothetical protein